MSLDKNNMGLRWSPSISDCWFYKHVVPTGPCPVNPQANVQEIPLRKSFKSGGLSVSIDTSNSARVTWVASHDVG